MPAVPKKSFLKDRQENTKVALINIGFVQYKSFRAFTFSLINYYREFNYFILMMFNFSYNVISAIVSIKFPNLNLCIVRSFHLSK